MPVQKGGEAMVEDNSIKLCQIKERWCAIFVDRDTKKPCVFRFSDALDRCRSIDQYLAICRGDLGQALIEIWIPNKDLNSIPDEVFKTVLDRPIYMATMGVVTFISFCDSSSEPQLWEKVKKE